MHIAIIGAGRVGGALGIGWTRAGHDVIYGVRDPNAAKVRSLLAETGGGTAAKPVAEAATDASVIALCTPWSAAENALQSLGDLDGRVLLDATNPIAPGLAGLTHGGTTSGGEQVATWAPSARVVKTLNTTGWENMLDPVYDGVATSMFLCGDDEDANLLAAGLLRDLGFDPRDVGPLAMCRYLEPMAMVWIHLAHSQGLGTGIAFRLMER